MGFLRVTKPTAQAQGRQPDGRCGFAQRWELCAPSGAFSGGPPGEGVPGGNEISGVDHRGTDAGDGVSGFLECRGRGAAALIEVEAVPVEGAACGAGATATGVGGGDCLLEPAAAFGSGVEDVAGLPPRGRGPGGGASGGITWDPSASVGC